jgi:hypothetical protein
MRSASKRFSSGLFVLVVLVSCFFIHPFLEADSKEREDSSNHDVLESQTAGWLQLSLVWYDTYRLCPRSFEDMSREVNRIFGEVGVDVRWKTGVEADKEMETSGEWLGLYVILLPSSSSSWGLGEHVMGAATHREGERGSVYLFYPQIVKTLNLGTTETPYAVKYLPRAIARVIVHEVIHVLAPDYPHTGNGLMNWHLTQRFLTRPRVSLDADSARVVRAEIQVLGNQIVLASVGFGGEMRLDELKAPLRPTLVKEQPR